LYYGAARAGLRLAYLNGAVTALWPPVGVGIAALVLGGLRLWPGVVIGDLLVGDFSTPLGTVLGQTVGNTLEVVIGAFVSCGWPGAVSTSSGSVTLAHSWSRPRSARS
jgi:integral membrane sensor domain MASE1